jgi:hypothetical protein
MIYLTDDRDGDSSPEEEAAGAIQARISYRERYL